MFVAMVLLPTPPLALLTAMTLVTLAMGRFSGSPRFIRAAKLGGVPDRGRPWCVLAVIQENSNTSSQSLTCRLIEDVRCHAISYSPMGSHVR
jgi:hypothetical protein